MTEKVIHLKRTYIVPVETQLPILRTNSIAKRTKTKDYKEGDKIKMSDFKDIADNKPQFKGWTGEMKIVKVSLDLDEWPESPTYGLLTLTLFVK